MYTPHAHIKSTVSDHFWAFYCNNSNASNYLSLITHAINGQRFMFCYSYVVYKQINSTDSAALSLSEIRRVLL